VRTRFGESAWVHVEELAAPDAWGEIEARVRSKTEIEAHTKGIAALRFDRDAELLDASLPVTVTIDGVALSFAAGDAIALHQASGAWRAGPAPHEGPYKHGDVSGPIRDVFHAPLLFVYGATDPSQTRANEEVARAWAAMRWGGRVKFPVMSDVEFFGE